MAEDSDILQQLFSTFLSQSLGFGNTGAMNWQQYGGVNRNADTVVSRGRQLVLSFANQIPLVGPILGPYIADKLIGDDFHYGILGNTLSGLMAPSTGTYAGTFQNLWNKRTISSLRGNREAIRDNLRNDFLRNYYKVTMGLSDQDEEESFYLDQLVAQTGTLSLPSILNFALDPASNRKILENIKSAQSGALSWYQRQHTKDYLPGSEKNMAKAIAERMSNTIQDMAKQANRFAIGMGDANEGHFGGFTGAQVSQIASILSNAAQQIDPENLERDVNAFKDKVKSLARALSPLKDIFGHDVKAMTDMLQAITGQSISQLTPAMVQSLATSTVDMSRYSGATAVQMAQAGRTILSLSANMGGTTFSRVGAGTLGAYYSGLMAAGNAPAGVHAAQYAAHTQQALASAQASQGTDWAAMAYGVWVQQQRKKNPNADTSIQTFMRLVSEKRASSPDMMTALVRVAGKNSVQDLLRGKGTTQYRVALQNPNLAKLGIEEQYRQHLQDTLFGLAQNNPDISVRAYENLFNVFSNSANAGDIRSLVANANDPEAVRKFAAKYRLNVRAVNTFLNSQGSLQKTARWASQENIKAYQQAQAQLKKELQPLQAFNGGGLFSVFNALTKPEFTKKGKVKVGNVAISTQAVQQMMGGILGTSDIKQTQAKIEALVNIFGRESTARLLQTAGDKLADDPALAESLQVLAELGSYEGLNEDAEKQKKWKQAYRKVALTQVGLDLGYFKDKAAINIEEQALEKYRTGAYVDQKERQEDLRKSMKLALQYQNVANMKKDAFSGDTDQIKKSKLESFQKLFEITGGEFLSKEKFDALDPKTKGKLSWQDYRQAMRESEAGYDLKEDALRTLKTMAEQLLNWLRKHE